MTTTNDTTLVDAVRDFLAANPGASRRQLFAGVEGTQREILAAFGILEERGEARYVEPEKRGQPGRYELVAGAPSAPPAPDDHDDGDDELWKSAARCPTCGRPPNVRFTRREVERARRERQTARLQTVRCTRDGTRYWIMARDIAGATLDGEMIAA